MIRLEATRPISASVKFLLIFNLPFLDLTRIIIFYSNKNYEISVLDDNIEMFIV
jgi:hypothetical protein